MNYISIDNKMSIRLSGLQSYQFGDIEIYVDGLLYVYGKKAGAETVEWLFERFHSEGIIPFEELRGAYSCIIKEKDRITAFSDNSNMHCLYYTDNMLSNSFLRLVENEVISDEEPCFDLEAICEYLTLGNVFFDKTFFSSIHILPSTKLALIKNNKIMILQKQIEDIDAPSKVGSINDFFDKVAFSLSEMRVCQALTGGYDSRVVYACLSKRIKDHPAISAGTTNNNEVKCAQKVAAANQDSLEIIRVEKPVFCEDLIEELFEKNDGIIPLDIDGDIRLLKFKTTLAKDYNIHLSGDGGAVHKDREWSQDFPFFRKKKSNSKQFYKQRLYYLRIDDHIGVILKSVFSGQAQRFEKQLDSISKSINTQSYDSWYYRCSGNRRINYNCNPVNGLTSYAPLNEIDIVRYSYALPRWKRFFCNSYRDTITNENKRVARVKTIYDTNASSEWLYILMDVFFQSIEYFRKAIRMIGRSVFNVNVLNAGVLDWSMEEEIRDSDIAARAIKYAKENGFIGSELTMDTLSYSEMQRIIHIYCLYCFVSDSEKNRAEQNAR